MSGFGLACCFYRTCQGILQVVHCLALDAFGGSDQPPSSLLGGGCNLRVHGYALFLSLKLAHFTSTRGMSWYARVR
eukprot:scaffold380436_cov38-Prasinocladus_malaysianus.AAC.1